MEDSIKYIVYASFTTANHWMPCVCDEGLESEYLNNSLKLINVITVSDPRFPTLEINEVHVLKKNILYIAKANLKEQDPLKEMLDEQLNIKTGEING